MRLGENPSSQASLVTLCGIARKLGGSLGQSWEKMIEVLCHLYFLGLFPIAQYNNHQYELLSENELANFVVMVNGLMEEKFSNRKGLISRLLTWSRESEQDEQQIQKAFEGLVKGKTVIMIAHRLSTIQDADLILVMKQGELVESGTHDALVKQGGEYAKMWSNYTKTTKWHIGNEVKVC